MMSKRDEVSKIEELCVNNNGLFVLDCKGVDSCTMSSFREDLLMKCGVHFLVVKNTLFKVAVAKSGYSMLDKFSGQCGVIFCNNFLDVAKVVNDYCFVKKILKFYSCVNENEVYDDNYVKEMASLPTLEVLRQKVMCSINSVGSSLLYVLSQKFCNEKE